MTTPNPREDLRRSVRALAEHYERAKGRMRREWDQPARRRPDETPQEKEWAQRLQFHPWLGPLTYEWHQYFEDYMLCYQDHNGRFVLLDALTALVAAQSALVKAETRQ